MDEAVRLNRYISLCGVCSRREADRLIEDGRVQVDGQPAKAGMQVNDRQCIMVDGREIHPVQQGLIYLLNKPAGYVCTTDNRWGDPLVADLIPSEVRLFPMGRLDKDSRGLLLMTNRGDLVNKVMKAGNRHEKEYEVTVGRKISEAFLEQMAGGIWLEELQTVTRPCKVWKTGTNQFHIVLTQGLNRQIRRMCNACGYHVTDLCRVRIMNLELGELKSGECRRLTAHEVRSLEQLVADSPDNPEHGR